ncbi:MULTISPECIES: M13 family metallopeptidase [Sphingobacterium]|uniref:Endothelin-converting protein n=1 Tax=Sphingobacterium cellulitidis TaxID=1768011 RepID=A0A8H9KVC6_9SPHI|nr:MULTISPECIES: M13 family metallopeptidase [Sphingobacterium]MBA8988283.1 putative endopeptidase [Sphingobacterium soli]OYD43082.1 endothelin-converting protein [Sphingobacterium cellulitidis]OYD47577.1 endothelin-converting protein [Sphingobacterium cellulitidis]WFB62464.1 M13 family metallopeptidase [Sphingobacterium sp. WM]GGE29897.1 endothelin-converting protein [Sphingobacterium soli]
MKQYVLMAALLAGSVSVFAQEHQAINVSYMDKSVRPQDDFYNYVNGNWMKTVEIPSDKARWGSFDQLRENTDEATLKILKESLNTKFEKGTDGQKIADLYKSYVDFDTRNKLGITPIQQQLKDIDQVKNLKGLYDYFVKYGAIGGNPFFGAYVYAHMKNSNMNAVYLGGGGLGLGRTYYQKEDEKNTETLGNYNQYINALYGKVDPKTRDLKGPKVIEFEKLIASNLKTVEEQRDAQKRYNPVAVKDLQAMVKNMDVAKYIQTLGFKADTVIIGELRYYQNLDKIVNEQNLPVIKEYLKFHVMDDATGYLTADLDQLSFDFYGKKLRGQKEQRALDKRGLEFVNGNAGELLGKLYVKENFPAEAKAACEELVQYLIKSFNVHIKDLAWMSPTTKEKALEKLSKFTVKIGYPDKWKDYSSLQVGTSLVENVNNVRRWAFEENLAKQGKPVDKSEWGMTPQTVNAYYSPLFNEIVFPAAILQPPFYDYKADPGVNFGGIGAVIGHELSHGFDDSGSQYDGNGNLNNWWTEEDKEKFNAAADALVAQFEAYEPVPGVFVNGRFTLGENIGDLGGSSVAFDALQMYLKDKGNPGLIDGYTQDQRFFLSWATIWRTKTTDEFVVNQVKTDPHSPAQYRATGPIINLDAFHKAFDTKEGDKLYLPKDKRIVIW